MVQKATTYAFYFPIEEETYIFFNAAIEREKELINHPQSVNKRRADGKDPFVITISGLRNVEYYSNWIKGSLARTMSY